MNTNEEMTEYLLKWGHADERVANAMRKIDRKLFVPRMYEEHAYSDAPLPIGFDQTISAPSIVALMSTKLDVRKGMNVLEIGSGSGYQAAILAELIGEKGKLYTVERIPEIAELARRNLKLLSYENVEFIYGDGTKGYPEKAPFDRIIVTAAAPGVPKPLIEQLRDPGKLIIPVGSRFWQDLILLRKENGKITTENLLPVLFVPLKGEHGFRD